MTAVQDRGRWSAARLDWFGALILTMSAAACGGTAIVDAPLGEGGSGDTLTPTGTPTGTTTGTGTPTDTGTPTGTGTGTDVSPECAEACIDLFVCTQETELCPELDPADGQRFIEGCHETCTANPAMAVVIDSGDCWTTVQTLLLLRDDFARACQGE